MMDGQDVALLHFLFEDTWGPFGPSAMPPDSGDTDPVMWPAGGGILRIRVTIAPGGDPNADPSTYSWIDVSQYVQHEGRVRIKRGKGSEQGQAEAAVMTLRLLNSLGRFSPRNPVGPYWGTMRRNTPVRVELNWGTGWHIRYTGTVPNWQPRQDATGNYRYVDVEAVGVLGRLGQGKSPTRSPAMRTALAAALTMLAFWSFESDGNGQDSVTSIVSETGSTQITINSPGVPSGADAGPYGAGAKLPTWTGTVARLETAGPGDSSFTGSLGSSTAGFWSVGLGFRLVRDASLAASTNPVFWRLLDVAMSDGTTVSIVAYAATTASYKAIDVVGVATTAAIAPAFDPSDEQWHEVYVSQAQSGVNVVTKLYVDQTLYYTATAAGTLGTPGSFVGATPGYASLEGNLNNNVGSQLSMGYLRFDSAITTYPFSGQVLGYPGESATARFARLCVEDRVSSLVPVATTTQAMGAQAPGTLLDLLRSCELAAEGTMVERLDGRLGLDPPRLRANQDATLALSWSGHNLVGVPGLVDDDLLVHNDVTVTRVGGAARRLVDSTSAMGTGTNGVGTYDEGQDIVLSTDSQALEHASLRRGMGTVDEQRLAGVRIHLTRTPALIEPWSRCDIGSRVTISGPPAYDTDGNPLDQILEGYTETIDQNEWVVDLNLVPELPYENLRIGKTDTTTNRSRIALAAGSTTVDAPGVSSTAVSIPVTSRTVRLIDSATYPTYFPFDIMIDGERMTVTAVTTAALSQTLTVTRSVNGVVKAISPGASVTLFRTPRIAL